MPKKLPGEDMAPRVPFSLRTTPTIRDRLEADARRSGRALAVEAEARLESSYAAEDLLDGPETHRLLLGLARALKQLAAADGGLQWHQNPALTWDRISERLGEVYTFDHELSLPRDADQSDAEEKPMPTEEEMAAAMKARGARWATTDELKTFQWTESAQDAPAKRTRRKP